MVIEPRWWLRAGFHCTAAAASTAQGEHCEASIRYNEDMGGGVIGSPAILPLSFARAVNT